MLIVKAVEPERENELAYECYDNGERVGRLSATWQAEGYLIARLSETSRREAGRSLVAKLERDALANGLTSLYLEVRDAKEREQFLPTGYEPLTTDSLLLCKRLS